MRKNKKFVFSVLASFLVAFIFYLGYEKIENIRSQAENSKAEMQDKLKEQQSKIDELQNYGNEQDQKIIEQSEKMAAIEKNQENVDCQKIKERCEVKISTLSKDRNAEVEGWQKKIDAWNDNLKEEALSGSYNKSMQEVIRDNIKDAKKEIERLKQLAVNEAMEKDSLLSGECKNYKNPCE